MKKIIMSAMLAASVTTSVFAAGFEGAYVGGDMGYTTLKSNGLASTIGSELESSNVNFGAQLGYGAKLGSSFYLGGEFGFRNNAGDFGDKTTTISRQQVKLSATTSRALSFSVLPGFIVSPNTLVYARLGRINVDTEATMTNLTTGASFSTTSSGNANIYGLGVDYLVSGNLSVKAEANKISASDTDGTTFNLGVNYRF